VINDVGSTNGTFVNDEPVDFAVTLRDGDRVRLGSATLLRFSLAAGDGLVSEPPLAPGERS
jgi:pSer/pThr/pTyr-binding forkhead associated (FHA) protein